MDKTDLLFETDPFDFSAENRQLFVDGFRETAAKHYRQNAVFRAFWQDAGIHPDDLVDEESLVHVPPLMVHLFKERTLVSVPPEDLVLTLTSSGTTGQKSRMFLNQRSLDRVKRLAFKIHQSLGMTSSEEANYLCFVYDPAAAKDLGTAYTSQLVTSMSPVRSVTYALRWSEDKHDFVFDVDFVVETLKRFEQEGLPVRIFGFPAFLYQILQQSDFTLDLGPHSMVETGGGWKNLEDQQVPKPLFRKLVARRLGIPVENIRDMFGMVEHGVPYCDCRLGHLHISNYSRVWIRSPWTLGALPEGESGLVQFMCCYNDSCPSVSLLTTDWGRLGRCECGLAGQTLELLGRAGVSKHKGCAVKAAELHLE
jgi:phenylacetate-coenzyme A ligase PaaK-like adenylate-forming protein